GRGRQRAGRGSRATTRRSARHGRARESRGGARTCATRSAQGSLVRRRARLRRVRIVLEAVPNVSEARDPGLVGAIGDAFEQQATLLDVHSRAAHNRSVYTLVADELALVESLLSGIRVAVERIDLREHVGTHPRIGVADVVPLVPLEPSDPGRAVSVASTLARRIGDELRLPVFLYGDAADGRRPLFFRRGGFEELTRRVSSA